MVIIIWKIKNDIKQDNKIDKKFNDKQIRLQKPNLKLSQTCIKSPLTHEKFDYIFGLTT